MKSAIMMFHLRFPGARSILHRAESHLVHTRPFMPEHLSNCACTCRTKACFISQDYPGQKAWYPPSTGLPCLPTRFTNPDPIRTCLSFFQMVLRTYAHIKSSSGEERQIWEYLERRGGRVGHPDQFRDGSNAVADGASGAVLALEPNVV